MTSKLTGKLTSKPVGKLTSKLMGKLTSKLTSKRKIELADKKKLSYEKRQDVRQFTATRSTGGTVRFTTEEESSVSSCERDAEALEEVADSSFVVFTSFPGKSARDARDFSGRLLMPRAESLYREWDKDKTFPPTGLKRLIVLAVAIISVAIISVFFFTNVKLIHQI